MIPKISVVITVYNGERYIGDAIDSILNQTIKDLELIIVDDGSDDRTVSIINSYADKRIVLIRNEENKGIAYSANRGLNIARAPYIARMDSDDISLPDRLEKQYYYMKKHPHIALCGGPMLHFGREKICEQNATSERELLPYFLYTLPVGHSTWMMKAEVIKTYNIKYNEGLRTDIDYYFMYELLQRQLHFAVLEDILVCYRYRKDSISHKDEEDGDPWINTIKVQKKMLSLLGIKASDQFIYYMNQNRYKKENRKKLPIFLKIGKWYTHSIILLMNKKVDLFDETMLRKALAGA